MVVSYPKNHGWLLMKKMRRFLVTNFEFHAIYYEGTIIRSTNCFETK